MDLILDLPRKRQTWVIEIKRGLTPRLGRGFHSACRDVKPTRAFVVYGGTDRYPLAENVEAIGLRELVRELTGG